MTSLDTFSPSNDASTNCNVDDTTSTTIIRHSDPGGPQNEPSPRAKFRRRNSMNALSSFPPEEDHGSAIESSDGDGSNGFAGEANDNSSAPQQQQQQEKADQNTESSTAQVTVKKHPPIERSVARLCGPCRSKCGYCGGKRLHVLGVQDEYNKSLIARDATTIKTNGTMKNNGEGAKSEQVVEEDTMAVVEHIDETTTSKSYGLLFDRLPYSTYEDLINRGWRRSGQHLYRPHNFESCCPMISIRLDVLKFASRNNNSKSTTKEHNGKSKEDDELSRAILVGGSKSQRKVGKTILRALESHNTKCLQQDGHHMGTNIHHSIEAGLPLKHRSSVLSSDDTVGTSHVANMQLDDSSDRSSRRHGKKNVNESIGERKQCNKKSRKRSPDRDNEEMGDKSAATSATAAKKAAATVSTPKEETCRSSDIQSFLDKLSEVAYEEITARAIKAVAGMQSEEETTFKWAWWNDNDNSESMTVPKWCTFKVIQPRASSKGQKVANPNNNGDVVVTTSACAAAYGRSRGGIDKSQLVHSVVDVLKAYSRQNSEDNAPRIKDVSYHGKSGHIHVTLKGDSSGNSLQSTRKSASSKRRLNTSNNKQASLKEADAITEFITRQKTMVQKLNKLSSDMYLPKSNAHRQHHQQRFLTVRSVPAYESSVQLEVHQLYCRYQSAVHGDYDPFFGTSDKKKSKEKDDFHDYSYYQTRNLPGFLDVDIAYGHLDEVQRSKIKTSYLTFYRFLCETPVAQDEGTPSFDSFADEDGYDIHIPFGTYHQQYRLSTSQGAFDGPLIAVGVVDILPQSLSSVYAFYDPILSSALELGKYTALREIEWVRRASQFRPDLHYYYLGYYIHSCQKMTYKAEYKPSELLCPVNLKWVDYEAGKKRLEQCSPLRHCCALTDPSTSDEEETEGDRAKPKFRIEDVMLDIGEGEQHLLQVGMLSQSGREYIDPHVNEFVTEVGHEMCRKFVIKLR